MRANSASLAAKFCLFASTLALLSCTTMDGEQTTGNDEIIVTASKTASSRHQPSAPAPIALACWDGSMVTSGSACPARPAISCWDGSLVASISSCPVRSLTPPTSYVGASKPSTQNVILSAPTIAVMPTPSVQAKPMAKLADGQSYVAVPAEFETITETVVVQEAATELVQIPATYETITETIVVQPQSTDYQVQPDGTLVQVVVPAITKQVSRRVIRSPASTQERAVPAITKQATRRVIKVPAYVQIVDAHGNIIQTIKPEQSKVVPKPTGDAFANKQPNPYKLAAQHPVSTFSADVDTASYSIVRGYVKRGQRPPAASIRIEELVNYFDYNYEVPRDKTVPFKPTINIMPSPWNAETKLLHIGIKGYEPPARKRPPLNLVFLVDVSGSMDEPNKLPLLKKSFKILVDQLRPEDKLSIVTYGPTVQTVLEPTSGYKKYDIMAAVSPLYAAGGTAGEAGLQTAYEMAERNFKRKSINRVVLATDGDFNIGISDPNELKQYIAKKRDKNIYLSVLGFGQGNLKDTTMQALAQNGNGNAGYIDTLDEAKKFFGKDMTSNFVPIANDVKIQVEFNPDLVSEYRLLGYETRALKRQDFNNDKIDAGDIGAGHSVTAIYEFTPKDAANKFIDPLRYGGAVTGLPKPESDFGNEYAFVKLRYKLPGKTKSKLITRAVSRADEVDNFKSAPKSARFAAMVAAYGLKLRGDQYITDMGWAEITKNAKSAMSRDANGYKREFLELTKGAERM